MSPFSPMRILRSLRGLIRGPDASSGSAMVEAAILAPVLITLTLYAIDFGLHAFTKMEAQHAAQAGAQYAIGQVKYDSAAISSAVTRATKLTGITPSSSEFCGCPTTSGITFCAATCDKCNTGTCALTVQGHYVTVTAAANYTPIAPYGVSTGTFDISAKSTVRIR